MQTIIDMTVMAKEFGALPRQGGLLDQDYLHIKYLKAGLHGLSAHAEKERRKGGH